MIEPLNDEEIQQGLELGAEICKMILKPGANKSISAVALGSAIATLYCTLCQSVASGDEVADHWVDQALGMASTIATDLGNPIQFVRMKKDDS